MTAPAIQSYAGFTTATVTKPSGVTATDYVVVMVAVVTASSGDSPTCSGMTKRFQRTFAANGGGGYVHVCVFDTNGADVSASPSSWTITQAGAFSTTGISQRVSGTSGWDAAAGHNFGTQFGSASPYGLPAVTTSAADDLVSAYIVYSAGSSSTPTGWTDLGTTAGSGKEFWKAQAAAGSSGSATTTPTTSSDMYVTTFAYKAVASPALVVADLAAGATIGATGALTQHQALAAAGLGAAATISPVVLTPSGALTVANLAAGATIGAAGTLTQHAVLGGVANLAAGATIAAVTLGGTLPPGAPTAVQPADAFGYSGGVSLSWTAPATGGTPTDYTVQYSADDGSSWTTYSHTASTATSITLTGLAIGTRYAFQVRAVNGSGNGSYARAEWGCTPTTATAPKTWPTGTTQSGVTWSLGALDERTGTSDGSFRRAVTGAGVRIYIIDSGARSTHVEFATALAAGRFIAGGDMTGGGNAFNDDIGHGTEVASKAVGSTLGPATGATAVIVKAYGASVLDLAAGFEWIRDNHPGGPAVVTSSLLYTGTVPGTDPTDVDPVIDDLIAMGIAVCQCVGNTFDVSYSLGYKLTPRTGLIHVGGTNSGGGVAGTTQFTPRVDVFAPSEGNTVALNTGDSAYSAGSSQGTSFATPEVAGVIAMWLQVRPDLSAWQIDDLVKASSTKNVLTGSTNGEPNRFIYSLADIPALTLNTANLAAGASIATAGALTQHQTLTVANLAAGATLGTAVLTQHQALTVANLAAGATIAAAGTLTQHQALAAADLAAAATIEAAGALTQHQALAAADLAAGATIAPAGALTQHQSLTGVANLAAGATIEAVVLGVAGMISAANLAAGATISTAALTQHQVLAGVANLAAGATIEATTLVLPGLLAPANLAAGATVSAVTLVQHQALTVQGLTAGATVGPVVLSTSTQLTVANLGASSTVGPVTLTVNAIVLVVAGLRALTYLAAAVDAIDPDPERITIEQRSRVTIALRSRVTVER